VVCAHDDMVHAAKIDVTWADVVGDGRLRVVESGGILLVFGDSLWRGRVVGYRIGDYTQHGAVACDEALECVGDSSVELCVDFLFWFRLWVVMFF